MSAKCSAVLAVNRISTVSTSRTFPLRAFSISNRRSKSDAERVKEYRNSLKQNDPEKHQEQLQKRRDRARFIKENDPVRHERILQRTREWYAAHRKRLLEEPGLHEQFLKRNRDRWTKWIAVPENRAQYRKNTRLVYQNDAFEREAQRKYLRDRYRNDADFRSSRRQAAVFRRQKHQNPNDSETTTRKNQPVWKDKDKQKWNDRDHMHQAKILYRWVRRSDNARQVQWRTHELVDSFPEKVEHFCSGCGYTHFGGKSLWWRRRSDPNLYDCHSSFASDWSRALPIGHEHMVFGTGRGKPNLELQRSSSSPRSESKSKQKSSKSRFGS